MPAGRPSEYRPEFVETAAQMCANGATDMELADEFEVSVTTIYNWRAKHPEFLEAVKTPKGIADDRVERSLFERAIGYSHNAVRIFMPAGAEKAVIVPYVEHVPPDTSAATFWLKNRKPAEWRDKTDVAVSGQIAVRTLNDFYAEIAKDSVTKE
jgi:hypothetical protein